MSARFEIVEAKAFHCGQMARLLRAEHRQAIALIGIDAHRELRACFDASVYRKAWVIDGRLAGLGGVTGGLVDPYGQIWLALSAVALRYPVAIVREAKRQLDAIMVMKRELVTSLIAGDEAAKRFAIFLNFFPYAEEDIQPAFSRYGRRSLRQALETMLELRIPMGDSFVINVGYRQPEAA